MDSFLIHTDLPVLGKVDGIFLNVYYSSDTSFKGDLDVQFYKYSNESDSALVLRKRLPRYFYKQGLNKIRLDCSENDTNTFADRRFYEILKKTGSVSPGSYKVILSATRHNTVHVQIYLHQIDSILAACSPVRRNIDKSLSLNKTSFMGLRLKKAQERSKVSGAGIAFMHARNRIDRSVKKLGLQPHHYQKDGISFLDLYYEDWFAGRYEIKDKGSLAGQIREKEDIAGTSDFNSVTTNDLGYPTLFSQYKALNKSRKDQDEVKGTISLTTNTSSGQEQNSDVDNNYYELKGMTELPIVGLPMVVEGLYTSQDNHRTIKSSYFRVHYDIDKMKDELSKSINSYNTKFSATKSKGSGMEQIYNAAISRLEAQKVGLQKELNGNSDALTNELHKQIKDTSGVVGFFKRKPDSTNSDNSGSDGHGLKKGAQKAVKAQKETEEKKKKIEELDKKIEKYKLLIAQSKNTNYFDSSLGYDKTKDISSQGSMSYKKMAKSSSYLLPDGKAKNFVAGITTMGLGMFPKYESKYTMSGQMMKGGDFGYDLGFCETGITAGKTEFAGRNGNLDKYTFYSAKAMFKVNEQQKIGVRYYGYSADRKLYSGDVFFNNVNISAPGFFEPVHIISTTYSGTMSKFVSIEAEAATSMKNADKRNIPKMSLADKMAYHFIAEGNVPHTFISIQASYDRTGIGFENNTLPMSMAGTEQYKISGKNDFFRGVLVVGVEFDRLTQVSFATTGKNTKWGFDVKTNFKRYPNIGLSYKPFTTFHSHTDTLGIPQRPLVGAVWTGKSSYRLKRKSMSLRFSVLYNKSMTTMDTAMYGNNLLQFTTIHSDKIFTNMLSVGYLQVTGTATRIQQTAPNNTKFISMSTGYTLSKQLIITAGEDIGLSSFGLCRYSTSAGITYSPHKKPLAVRVTTRYNNYMISEADAWKRIYSGSIDISYKFKAKTK